jgi:hypothetical protein
MVRSMVQLRRLLGDRPARGTERLEPAASPPTA